MMGRNNPSAGCRVFSDKPKNFYKIDPIRVNFDAQHKVAIANGIASEKLVLTEIEKNLLNIKELIKDSEEYKNLFEAVAIPFCMEIPYIKEDIGTLLEDHWLPMLKKEYEKKVPGTYFKSNFQGEKKLKNLLTVSEKSGYEKFFECAKNSSIVGYYFPTAFQEFDIKSQRMRIGELPSVAGAKICLSGPFEIIYSLVCYPKLLFSKESYCPILCASSLEHNDPRMVLMFKSYGPHLEFWLMSQMLTPSKTQVSEQWAGGITVFNTIK